MQFLLRCLPERVSFPRAIRRAYDGPCLVYHARLPLYLSKGQGVEDGDAYGDASQSSGCTQSCGRWSVSVTTKAAFSHTRCGEIEGRGTILQGIQGVIIPDERRRWLRQHGVLVKKNPRTEETYIDSDALRRPANAATNKAVEGHQGQKEQQQQQQQNDEESGEKEENTEMNVPPVSIKNPHEEGITVKENPAVAAPNPSAHGRPKRIIPLGPNGTLTRGQKVQLIRDRYRDAKTVPRFYVCHRCGEKGNHWVDECPKRDDENFGRQTVWGEERLEPARQKHRTEGEKEEEKAKTKKINENEGQMEEIPSPPGGGGGNTKGSTTAFCEGKDLAEDDGALEILEDDGDPPAESSARRDDAAGDSTNPTTEVSRMLAPVAAAALTEKKGKAQQRGSSRSRTRPPPPPTLYERLVESRKANEHGLLLQAFRFFVMRRFFEPL
ncbi:hypothetical protein C4B63_10g458 [Trypanosoma cruzi]|uniref:Zinc knuckle CX2CX3GHX4C domain-containing protein n=1 Tax=Trypanosoma cruzi TaxID=5693 RepID=A0A2V2VRH5_TRYCR|nr:hypothetical protein C4B63_10g458 [Trypanosoma cruzi]